MDYEKKYKDLVKAVKELQEANPSDEGIQNWVNENVPKLVESGDERIRKELIDFVKSRGGFKQEYIAWLEKQDKKELMNFDEAEKEKSDFVGDGFIKCFANFLDFKEGNTYWLEYIGNDKYNVRSDNLLGKTYHITPCQLYTVFKKLTWLEKQGEQETLCDKCKKAQPSHSCQDITELGRCVLEQGEQKPVDKVEPEFHEGDWVILTVGELSITLQIVKVDTNKKLYWFNDSSYLPIVDEECLHLWTIQDAKEGDVLYLQHDGKEHIIIYKGVIKERFRTFISAYCAYNSIVDDFCFADVSRYADIAYGSIMPATKEQCDFLFQKMKDAGYEWDAEKKELKKINSYCKEHCRGYQETGKCYADGSCDAKIKAEQKPVWSEEDDKLFSLTLDMVEWYSGKNEKNSRTVSDWLKSLKNRIIPQQKEWSEEDEQIALSIGQVMNCAALLNIVPEKIDKIRTWLQSLKQRVIWKPTVNEKSNTELAEPTPITPKILQKNGFELKPNGWLWCQDKGNEEQNYIFIQFRKDLDEVRLVEISFVGKIQGTFRQVQDVHELQNLLNVCRIKKEIEL